MSNVVEHGRKNTKQEALESANKNKIFFPTDDDCIVMGGKAYGDQTQIREDLVAETARAKAAEEANTQAIAKRGIYDVTAHNNGAIFESLSALLNNANLSTLIPTSVRCGGMSIRFIQGSVANSDNNYAQFRLMAQSFTTDISQWQGVANEIKADSKDLAESGSVDNRLSELIGVEYEGNMQTVNNSTNKTPITLKANTKYMIYVQSDDATSAVNNYSGIYDGDGGNLIMSVNKNEYLAGKSMIYTPSVDMNLYFRTQTLSATVNYKVYSMEVSTIKDIDNLLNDTIVKECWIPIAKDVLTANMVNVGDTIIISAKKAIASGGNIMARVNGSSSTLIATTDNLQTVRYVIPQGFEAINTGKDVIICIKNTKGIANTRELNKLSYAFTDIPLINKALKELFVMGSSYPSVNYRAEIVKEAMGRRAFTLINKSTNNAVAFCEITPLTINGTSYNKDNDYIIHGTQRNNSGIEFYAIIDWNELENGRYVPSAGYEINLLGSCFAYKSSPSIIEYLEREKYLSFINPTTFNYKIGYDWSGFISLENVKSIVYRLHKIYNEIGLYFYKNEMSQYSENYLAADYTMQFTATTQNGLIMGEVEVPAGYKYVSFRVSDKTDYVYLKKLEGFDLSKNIRFIESAKCISDGFLPSCGEPNLLYDKESGVVYENYIGGTIYGHDPDGNFGFARFPLAAPEQAKYSLPVTFGQTVINGSVVSFRDAMSYFKDSQTIRNIAFGQKDNGTKKLYYFDQNLDGTLKGNYEVIEWDDNTDVDYNSYISKVTDAGCTPYLESNDNLLLPSSSHVQEYNGYKYFTLTGEKECPMICRTDDDFATIEIVKVFQVKCAFELALVINGSDWYLAIRHMDGIKYTYSTDSGATWTQLVEIINAQSCKPRGLVYDGKIVFLIPTVCVENLCRSITSNEDGVLTNARYSIKLIRGDKNTPINEWKTEFVAASKYGINYGDLISVGKDLYFAWSWDKSHLHSLPTASKSQIAFARIGNIDNFNLFGDV